MTRLTTRGVWDVIPLVPLPSRGRQTFSYLPPTPVGEQTTLVPGMLVRVPFGPRTIRGIVWKGSHDPSRARSLKPISAILSQRPLFTVKELTAFQELARLSLASFASLLTTATRVREPVQHSVESTPHGTRGRGFKLSVRWDVPTDVLPKTPGGQVLILTPEIALAKTLMAELERRHLRVAFFAQSLGVRQRRALMERLLGKEDLTIVTTHAGIFLPLPTLSQIVVMEAALTSHRQWDLHPRYDARVGALFLARYRRVPLTLQTSLPSLDLARVSASEMRAYPRQPIQLVPRRTADPLVSHELHSLLQRAVERDERVLLFHDVVGAARLFVCGSCKGTLRCEPCGGILERAGAGLRCRSCGAAHGPLPHFCPRCRSPHLIARAVGTAQLEQDLRATLRGAVIVRADRETLPRGAATERGLPHGNVVLTSERGFAFLRPKSMDRIVVIDADRILEDGHFDAADRWVILIARLAALQNPRANNPLVLQSTHPHVGVVRLAAEGRFAEWEKAELADRERLGYPPFTGLLVLEHTFETHTRALATTQSLAEKFQASTVPLKVGYRIRGTSARSPTGQILLRGTLASLQHVLAHLPPGWKTDPHIPLSLLLSSR